MNLAHLPVTPCPPLEQAVRGVNFFWSMLLIIAKYACRNPWEESMGLLFLPVNAFAEVRKYLQMPPFAMEDIPPHPEPADKLRILRDLAKKMLPMMAAMEARGGEMPWDIAPAAIRYISVIEAIIRK
jgi:hypothetical protein